MKIYTCEKCNKQFNKKCNYEDHILKKKKSCINNNIIFETIEEDKNTTPQNPTFSPQNSTFSPHNSTFSPHNSTFSPHNSTFSPHELSLNIDQYNINNTLLSTLNDDNTIKKTNRCSFCDKSFSRSDSLSRHVEQSCKNKIHLDNVDIIKSKITNTDTITNEKYEKLVNDNIKLLEILEEYKHFIKENNLIKNIIPSTGNITNTNNGAINNGIVNSGSINSGNIINIVQFGKEDISKCNLIEMMNVYLKSTGGNIFSNILKYLNFNPKYPENFNILMSDLARENVKIHNGKKFVTKKFKTVKNDILNVLSGHINHMCDNYIEDPKIKKNNDILSKLKINDISVKLINDDDITPLLKDNKNEEDNDNDIDSDDESDIDDLNAEQERKLTHYENKRQGLQEITIIKLKDELYNNRDLIVNHHNIDVK
jgi:hypothetical protein